MFVSVAHLKCVGYILDDMHWTKLKKKKKKKKLIAQFTNHLESKHNELIILLLRTLQAQASFCQNLLQ